MTDVFMFLPPPPTAGSYKEVYPYGPDDLGRFHTALGVSIAAPQRTSLPARAVVAGVVGAIPNAGGSAGMLVLRPDQPLRLNLEWMPGELDVVFIYRNVALTHEYPRMVIAGDALEVTDEHGSAGGQLDFEIAFVPRALSPELSGKDHGRGWVRLQQMIDPQNRVTRRLDPTAFYAALARNLASSADGDRLAASDQAHPLLTLTTQRILLEVRDEYDQPFVGTINVLTRQGSAREYSIAADARGTLVLTTTTAEHSGAASGYALSLEHHLISLLPSGSSIGSDATFDLSPPAHCAVQTIYMADRDDPASWFIANLAPLPRFTLGNRVTPILDGLPAFAQVAQAIRSVRGADSYLRLIGWWLSDNFELIPDDTNSAVAQLTHEAASSGAQVNVLLWDQPGKQNSAEVDHINALPHDNGHAILAKDTLFAGSHHQKIMVVKGADGPLAFCGGMDINPDRLDDHRHCVQGKFHDVHAKIEGPAVADLDLTFCQRWNYSSANLKSERVFLPLEPMQPPPRTGSQIVQVARTYPRRMHYDFAPEGDLTTLNALRHAIGKAQRFIYVEDQYFYPYPGPYPYAGDDSVGILASLLDALARPSVEYLVMLMSNHIDDPPQYRYRRRNFIKTLRDRFPTKLHTYYLSRSCFDDSDTPKVEAPADTGANNSGGRNYPDETYVHAKTWVIDDVFVMIGSTNCGRRSYTHDSESSIQVIDETLRNGARAFARNYRMDLWAEHLGMKEPQLRAYLEDPTLALSFWQNPMPDASQRPYNEDEFLGLVNTDFNWDHIYDPDGR